MSCNREQVGIFGFKSNEFTEHRGNFTKLAQNATTENIKLIDSL